MITFLHTSSVHIDRFDNLVKTFDQNIKVKHIVNSNLLSYALEHKKLDIKNFQQEVDAIKKDNPDLIICTCSSYGAACNDTNQVKRIDFPIADYLVKNYTKIGLAFTAKSTEEVSSNLLQEVALNQKKEIEIIPFDCTKSWKYFQKNDLDKYEKRIAKKVKKLAPEVDVVFLAQASMEGAKKHFIKLKQKVFTSPEFGIRTYLDK